MIKTDLDPRILGKNIFVLRFKVLQIILILTPWFHWHLRELEAVFYTLFENALTSHQGLRKVPCLTNKIDLVTLSLYMSHFLQKYFIM